MEEKLSIEKLLDTEISQYKVAIAAFKRVYQIADNGRLRKQLSDTKRLPIVALADVLSGKIRIYENNADGERVKLGEKNEATENNENLPKEIE
ncbi:MAG: hypothetical protein ACOCUI_03460 [bacterium]